MSNPTTKGAPAAPSTPKSAPAPFTPHAPAALTALEHALALLPLLRESQKPARETILSRWGDYAKQGLVASTDRGTTLDSKKVGDLLKASAKQEDRKLEIVCSDFIARSRVIDALTKAIESKAL